ncbi:Biotin carboxylase [Lachnospiraceae bacterium XBB2008]|nr:Biotin carboxylase [Lachnospiraceae bacterium XBB2008]
MKKLLLLGGARYAIPVIEEAHKLDCKVITCDYLPENIAHRYSDGYENVSIIDKEAVLATAQKLNIDGIMSFACDPGVLTAAYVAEIMGLSNVGPYESVCILQNKNKFREFLRSNGFRVPYSITVLNADDALARVNEFDYPVIVKPTDSAGSKGVTKVDSSDQIKMAVEIALNQSIVGECIIEEFLESKDYPSDSECFSVEGKLVFDSWSAQHFDPYCGNPFTPAGFTWQPSISEENRNELKTELQRLISLLKMQTSIYNVEARETRDGKAYIMEVSPRGGGNRLAEMLGHVTGVNLIEASVKAALGYDMAPFMFDYSLDNSWAEIILHSRKNGRYKGLSISDRLEKAVIEKDLWVNVGDEIESFSGANKAIGTLVMRFEDFDLMNRVMDNPDEYINIEVE